MLHLLFDDPAREPADGGGWQPLRDLALSMLIVCAIALIVAWVQGNR